MDFGINILSIIPVRAKPDDRSEMVSQVLFGETMTRLETYKNWYYIRLVNDNYEGWIDFKQFCKLDEGEFNRINNTVAAITTDLVQLVKNTHKSYVFPLLIGSSLPAFEGSSFKIGNVVYEFNGDIADLVISQKKLCEYAMLYLRTPYMWGGRSPFGIDCSGFVQMTYKLNGVCLPRDASQQAMQGETINLAEEAEPGDLAFFDNAEGKIIHTGMLLNSNKIIHASGEVRIDNFDHQGIFNRELNKYTYNLRIIKRIL